MLEFTDHVLGEIFLFRGLEDVRSVGGYLTAQATTRKLMVELAALPAKTGITLSVRMIMMHKYLSVGLLPVHNIMHSI